MYLLNPLLPVGAKAPKRRGTGYGLEALKAKKKGQAVRKANLRPAPGAVPATKNKSGKRLSEKQLRKRAAPNVLPKPKCRKVRLPIYFKMFKTPVTTSYYILLIKYVN